MPEEPRTGGRAPAEPPQRTVAELGRRIAERLNRARGPVEVLLPRRGVSLYAKQGGPFHDPAADAQLNLEIRAGLRKDLPLTEVDTDINDPEFARLCAGALLKLLKSAGATNQKT